MLQKRLEEILEEEDYIEKHPTQLPVFIKLARAIAEKNYADNEVEATVFIEFALDAEMIEFLYTVKGPALYYLEDEVMKEDEDDVLEEFVAYFEGEEIKILEGSEARKFYEEETLLEDTKLKLIKKALNADSEIFIN